MSATALAYHLSVDGFQELLQAFSSFYELNEKKFNSRRPIFSVVHFAFAGCLIASPVMLPKQHTLCHFRNHFPIKVCFMLQSSIIEPSKEDGISRKPIFCSIIPPAFHNISVIKNGAYRSRSSHSTPSVCSSSIIIQLQD